ncbi:nucleotide exchange factor GrpE [Bizionia gelidisalsuginis]|uniref:Protein GrpE n=2 Tax=Bizionia TaxID=283785 RepID=A0A8H2QN21_9FLAO|nr:MULTISPECIES: nucleotide exchange factor GrpE [Bizionia]TYB80284.1 nucleotide exchange factor GrpE [Bizionia saleffrena]TYC17126.1 nucleotide exchange factor GrpE [Bizionia gelidisalsuginis]
MSEDIDKNEEAVEHPMDENTAEVIENEALSIEEKLTEELNQEKDKFLRLFAEFENYKRRTSKERVELFKTASEDVILSLLPVLDDFDRAYLEMSKTKEKDLLKGVELISKKLKNTLEQKGLAVVEVKSGDNFDADVHQAITQVAAPSDKLKGKIMDVLEKGYKLGDKIIRFPKVVTGQ